MIYYNRTDVSEGIDANKTSSSKECIICHYWCYFLNKRFKFCYECHVVLMLSMNLIDIAISNIFSADYRCIVNGISKSEAINSLKMST